MTPAAVDNWIVHPSRFELREDQPGNDSTYRPVVRPRQPTVEAFRARIHLPIKLLHLGCEDGTITFGGHDWWFVVGAARVFVATHTEFHSPPPFVFKRRGLWHWWDGSTSDSSAVETSAGTQEVVRYLTHLFPHCPVELRAP